MNTVCAAFLQQHPLTSRWLSDIIDKLVRTSNGTAHVRDLANKLWRDRNISAVEQTITRTINDYCSDAADFKKSSDYDLFERVAPATYRLRSFPQTPPLLEMIPVEFEERAMQMTWQHFASVAARDPRWNAAANQKRLETFAANMNKEYWRAHYQKVREIHEQPLDLAELGL